MSVSGTPMSLLRLPRVAQPGPVARQDRGDHLLDRGLAVAAGDGDHRDVELPAPECRQLPKRQTGVGDLHVRQQRRRAGATSNAPLAPARMASDRKWWPSKRGPLSATNRSPRLSVRVSVLTPVNSASRPMSGCRAARRRGWPATSSRRLPQQCTAPCRGRCTADAGRRPAGNPHDPCRPPARCRRRRRRQCACAIAAPRSRITTARAVHAGADFGQDRVRVLGARIVVGQDHASRRAIRRSGPSADACRDRGRRRSRTRTPVCLSACSRSACSTCSSASGVCA